MCVKRQKMSSVKDILPKIRLKFQDLRNLSTSQVEEIFLTLSVEEILTLSNIRALQWVNMIDLGDIWINEKTYKEMLDYVLLNGYDSILRLQKMYLIPYVYNKEDTPSYDFKDEKSMQAYADVVLTKEYVSDDVDALLYDPPPGYDSIEDFANEVLGRRYTYGELAGFLTIRSKEMVVIYNAVKAYKGDARYLPGTENTDKNNGYNHMNSCARC